MEPPVSIDKINDKRTYIIKEPAIDAGLFCGPAFRFYGIFTCVAHCSGIALFSNSIAIFSNFNLLRLKIIGMGAETYSFAFEVYHNSDALIDADRTLLDAARQATANAYAPYSKFLVAAAARLDSGEIICGTNQENASYPAGICAERVLLSAIASQHRGAVITTIAISYQNQNGPSEKPISHVAFAGKACLNMKKGNNTAYALYSVHSKGKCTASAIQVACCPWHSGEII